MTSLVEAPLPRVLASMVAPTFIGFGAGNLVGLVEMILISQTGELSIITVGVAGLVMMICAFFNEIPGGSSVIRLAQAVGGEKWEDAKEVARQAFYLKFTLGALSGFAVFLASEPLLRLMGADAATIAHGKNYFFLTLLGQPFAFCNWTFFTLLRGMGKAKLAMIFMLLLNALLVTTELVTVPNWTCSLKLGLSGVGIGFLLANASLFFISLLFLASRHSPLQVKIWQNVRYSPESFKILKLGLPLALTSLTLQGFAMAAGRIVNATSLQAFAALQIFSRISGLLEIVTTAFTLITIPVLAQNIGAGRRDRVASFMRLAFLSGGGFIGFCSILMIIFPVQILSLFTITDPALHALAVRCIQILAFAHFANLISGLINNWFNAHNDTKTPFWIGFVIRWGIHLPMLATALMVLKLPPVSIFWLGLAMALLTMGMSMLMMKLQTAKLTNPSGKDSIRKSPGGHSWAP